MVTEWWRQSEGSSSARYREAEVIEDVLEEEETELDWIHEADAELGGALC